MMGSREGSPRYHRARRASRRVTLLLAACWLLAVAALPRVAACAEPRMLKLVASSSQTHLILFAKLADAFDADLLTALRSGLPFRFEFQIEIHRERQMWPDQLLGSLSLVHRISYDTMNERYEFTERHGGQESRRSTTSLSEVQRWMNSVDGLAVLPRAELKGGRRYYLQVRAVISPDEELLEKNIYFFKKSGRRETEWTRSPLFGIGDRREP